MSTSAGMHSSSQQEVQSCKHIQRLRTVFVCLLLLLLLLVQIDAGADFIVTQLFYRVERYTQFVKDCRSIGIACPILPGVVKVGSCLKRNSK
jgi:hypothetical protein